MMLAIVSGASAPSPRAAAEGGLQACTAPTLSMRNATRRWSEGIPPKLSWTSGKSAGRRRLGVAVRAAEVPSWTAAAAGGAKALVDGFTGGRESLSGGSADVVVKGASGAAAACEVTCERKAGTGGVHGLGDAGCTGSFLAASLKLGSETECARASSATRCAPSCSSTPSSTTGPRVEADPSPIDADLP